VTRGITRSKLLAISSGDYRVRMQESIDREREMVDSIHEHRGETCALGRAGAGFAFVLSLGLTFVLFAGGAQAASYGCYIAGNWRCNSNPHKCQEYGNGPPDKYPTAQACKAKANTPKADGAKVPGKSKAARRPAG